MRSLRNVSIKRKLLLIIMLTSSVALLMASGAFVAYELVRFRQDMVRDLRIKADLLASQSVAGTAALGVKDARAVTEILNRLAAEKHIVAARIYTRDGKVLARYQRPDVKGEILPTKEMAEESYRFQDDHLDLVHQMVLDNRLVGTVFLRSDQEEMKTRLQQYGQIVAVVLLVSFGVAWLVSFRLQPIVSTPILELARTARDVSARQDYSLRAVKQGDDELGELMDGFNGMLAQIQRRDAALEQARKNLEQRVRERTHELQQEVSDRKQAEEKLKATAAQLERSNRELQDFAYVASHDLQEPLRKVQAFGDRLKGTCSKALGTEGRDYLERMQTAARRMQVLIEDLLAFSRVTTKANPFQSVDLGKIVREVLSDLEVRIQQSGGQVKVQALPTIDADPLQMRQLFQNLIGNALKFHQDGKPPRVRVRCALLGPDAAAGPIDAQNGGHCRIEVEDNGIGFDEKHVDRIFTPFQRLHGRSTYEGTGIGLAICRKIVDRHSGSVTARSVPGQGATFVVTLPLKQKQGVTA